MSMWRCLKKFCSKFTNFGTIFAAISFTLKTSVKIIWHEPNDIPTSSATSVIVIRRLSNNIFFTVSMGRASPLTYSRPSRNQLYHNWTYVLLIVDSPKQTRHSLHFKSSCTFNFIFYTKFNAVSLIYFLYNGNRRAHQNMTAIYLSKTNWQSKMAVVVNIHT